MNEPVVFAVFFDGWVEVAYTVAQAALTLCAAGLYLRERRIRKTWQPVFDVIKTELERLQGNLDVLADNLQTIDRADRGENRD